MAQKKLPFAWKLTNISNKKACGVIRVIQANWPPRPCCAPKIKYISNTKNPPGWGDSPPQQNHPQQQSMKKIKLLTSTRSKPHKK